jgi:Zn-dependent protease with chaperone function
MRDDQFKALVKRLDAYALNSPAAYKQRVFLLAFGGYAYLFVVLGLMVAAIFALVLLMLTHSGFGVLVAKLGIVLVILIWSVLSSLRVHIDAPQGVEVLQTHAPALFELIADLRRRLRSPKLHRVVVTDQFNMAVAQVPRWGPFGGYRHHLLLGLPLLFAIDAEQCRAILAHEFGHLSGDHGKFNTWIYRIRTTWMQLLQRLHDGHHRGAFIFTWFFDRYAPYFFAYSFVLARTVEYEADRRAAEVASASTLAAALVNTELRRRLLDESFWPAFFELHGQDASPPATAFSEIADAASGSLPETSNGWLATALNDLPGLSDSHPSLGQRLAALGFDASDASKLRSTDPLRQNAAESLMGDITPQLVETLSLEMQSDLKPRWQELAHRRDRGRQMIAELDKIRVERNLDASELWAYAIAISQANGEVSALPYIEAVIASNPTDPDANFWLGRVLAGTGDERGIAFLEIASKSSVTLEYQAASIAYKFFETRDAKRAQEYRQRVKQTEVVLQTAQAERQEITARDDLQPHALELARMSELTSLLRRLPVKRAYLARKKVSVMPEEPYFLLVIERSAPFFEVDGRSTTRKLLDDIRTAPFGLPGGTYISIVSGKASTAFPKLNVADGLIYQRS